MRSAFHFPAHVNGCLFTHNASHLALSFGSICTEVLTSDAASVLRDACRVNPASRSELRVPEYISSPVGVR